MIRLPWRAFPAHPADTVVFAPEAWAEMRAEADRGLPSETGGVLVGHRNPDGGLVVSHVLGPGPRALRTPDRFRRDGDYAQSEVDRVHAASGGADDYLGEWHTHPRPVGPSGVDFGSMAWIGGNAEYRTAEPLLVILQRTFLCGWRPLVYRWREGRLVTLSSAVARGRNGS